MDLVELVLRQYQRLAPPTDRAPTSEESDALENWLSASVCRIAGDLFRREDFQKLAKWPLAAFDYDADSPQRRLLRAVDTGLIEFARALVRLAELPSVMPLLVDFEARWPRPRPAESWLMRKGAGGMPSIAAVETIASRPWFDLAAPEEFFHPCRQLNTTLSEPRLDLFDQFASPKLPLLGDFVTRSIFLRTDYWREQLERLYGACVVALSLWGDVSLIEEALTARTVLEGSLQELTSACLTEPAFRLRECAISLVQIYNAYAATPNLEWLGVPADMIETERVFTRTLVRQEVCNAAAVEQIVAALMGAAEMYRTADDGREKLAKAVAEKTLVLVDSPRRAFWNSRRIDVDWERKPMLWELFWELASRAQRGLPVDRELLSNKKSERAIRDRRSDLGSLLPSELNKRIISAGRYTYRLKLPPEDVVMFVHEDEVRWMEEDAAALTAALPAARSHS